MIPAFVLKIVLFAVAVVVLVLIVRSLFLRPKRGAGVSSVWGRSGRPPVIVIVAVALLGAGLVLALLGFGSGDMRDPVPFRIASVVAVAAGLILLLMQRVRRRSR